MGFEIWSLAKEIATHPSGARNDEKALWVKTRSFCSATL
jgi:hypothetical protein